MHRVLAWLSVSPKAHSHTPTDSYKQTQMDTDACFKNGYCIVSCYHLLSGSLIHHPHPPILPFSPSLAPAPDINEIYGKLPQRAENNKNVQPCPWLANPMAYKIPSYRQGRFSHALNGSRVSPTSVYYIL